MAGNDNEVFTTNYAAFLDACRTGDEDEVCKLLNIGKLGRKFLTEPSTYILIPALDAISSDADLLPLERKRLTSIIFNRMVHGEKYQLERTLKVLKWIASLTDADQEVRAIEMCASMVCFKTVLRYDTVMDAACHVVALKLLEKAFPVEQLMKDHIIKSYTLRLAATANRDTDTVTTRRTEPVRAAPAYKSDDVSEKKLLEQFMTFLKVAFASMTEEQMTELFSRDQRRTLLRCKDKNKLGHAMLEAYPCFVPPPHPVVYVPPPVSQPVQFVENYDESAGAGECQYYEPVEYQHPAGDYYNCNYNYQQQYNQYYSQPFYYGYHPMMIAQQQQAQQQAWW
jgi:hypothetical protein